MKNFQKIRFYQDPDKRVTTAVLRFEDLKNEGGKIWDDWYFSELDKYVKRNSVYQIPDIVAITHAAPGEEWDAEMGKYVARLKLERQVYKMKRKWLSLALEQALDRVTLLNSELLYANKEMSEAEQKYKELARKLGDIE